MGATQSSTQAQLTLQGHLSAPPVLGMPPSPQLFEAGGGGGCTQLSASRRVPAPQTTQRRPVPRTQPPPAQQAFGVKAAHLQVAFRCHHFNQKKKINNSQLPRA